MLDLYLVEDEESWQGRVVTDNEVRTESSVKSGRLHKTQFSP